MSIVGFHERCKSCKGTKTLLALGNLRKACDNCGATGFIHHKPQSEVDKKLDEIEEAKPKIRKVRKKKGELAKPEPVLILKHANDNIMHDD